MFLLSGPQCWRYRAFAAVSLLLSTLHTADAKPGLFLDVVNSLQNILQGVLGNNNNDYGTCDGCFCIPDSGESCPVDQKPQTDYSSLIPVLRSFTWENPYTLTCDPIADASCDTTPFLQEGGACVVEFSGPADTCPANWSYSVSTYPGTFEEAMADTSMYVTHAGACGTCSSLQDLSVYMAEGPNLRDKSANCGIRGKRSKLDGIACFQDIGFTEGCSIAWYYTTKKNAQNCLPGCAIFSIFNLPPNGPPPQCKLAKCLQCDEAQAEPLFNRYAARSRRNSGLLSDTVRPCSEIVQLEQTNPCE
jgi:hypothetical protein